MTAFDTFAVVDWSGGNDTGSAPRKDAIWAAVVRDGKREAPVYLRNRPVAGDWLRELMEREVAAGRRLLIGFDFPFGYPEGFAAALTGAAKPLAVWDWIRDRLEDTPEGNNRFDLAAEINRKFPGVGPFWFNALKREIPDLPHRGTERTEDHALPERRTVETLARGSFTCWQLGGAGAVGSQALTGQAALAGLRAERPGQIAVWPFEPLDRPVALVEVWPSLLANVIRAVEADYPVRDAAQVAVTSATLAQLQASGDLEPMLDAVSGPFPEEGWILGVGAEEVLTRAAMAAFAPAPPRLADGCFALPPGISWTPVGEALNRLRQGMRTVVGTEKVPLDRADGRILACDHVARRSNPPAPNSAVDGYGFAHASLTDTPGALPLVDGRAAAGVPFRGRVPPGHAIRILTGALLPEGVDTVVLEEDTEIAAGQVAFRPPKRGANTRKAGEDVAAGEIALRKGLRLRPPDVALAAALGLTELTVHQPLRVAVLSTGDELAQPGATGDPERTYDANRPMLLHLLRRWGHDAVDLGQVADDREALRAALDRAAREADALLTSGGASAGDEDHVSALLRETGSLRDWRIALKPGRPLALALWEGIPVFGLPGNPVAACVCTLIFARPALSVMAGGRWSDPVSFTVPAAFSKSKKPGRREYLRARLNADGHAEVFKSEGSGRISGLSWADGLVEIGDAAQEIGPGDPVRFLPYAGFGLD